MDSIRLQKVSRLIQKELGIFFQRESHTFCAGKIVTVTNVRVSPDLGIARIYLSIFPSNKLDEAVKLIKNHSKNIRYSLGQKIRNQLRIIPQLEFFIDDSFDYIEKIDHLLKTPK